MPTVRLPRLTDEVVPFVQSIVGPVEDTLDLDKLTLQQAIELAVVFRAEWELATDPARKQELDDFLAAIRDHTKA